MIDDGHWIDRLLLLCEHISTWSKDNSSKIGAVIVDEDRTVIATGYNGMPRGVNDTVESRHQRPEKYKWYEHAERNAIYNAARVGVATKGCIIVIPWFPCCDCARAIVQSGIVHLVAFEPDYNHATWGQDFGISREILAEGGVKMTLLDSAEWRSRMGSADKRHTL